MKNRVKEGVFFTKLSNWRFSLDPIKLGEIVFSLFCIRLV